LSRGGGEELHLNGFIANPRRALRLPIRCQVQAEAAGRAWQTETEDIGPHGCQLTAPAALPRGLGLRLVLSYPGSAPLRVAGEIAWAGPHSPWRHGVAFAEVDRTSSSRWFDLLLAANPRLLTLERVPDRLPLDATLYLGPPPTLVDFTADEVTVLRQVGVGITVAALSRRLEATWGPALRALFSLLARAAVTLDAAEAAPPAAWEPALRSIERQLALELPRAVAAPPAPPAPVQARPPAPPLGTWTAPAAGRPPEAQQALDLARRELASGRVGAARVLLRRALQLAPRDAEIAKEMQRALAAEG